jgi:hypothetical protein
MFSGSDGTLDKGGNIQLHKASGNSLTAADDVQAGSTSEAFSSDDQVLIHSAGQLLAGVLEVAIQEDGTAFDAAQLARIGDAITVLNDTFGAYGVTLVMVQGSAELADIEIRIASTTAYGGAEEGLLGYATDDGEITIVDGWSWYTGADTARIGSDQYDFQTIVTHELGHTMGLGHSYDSNSVMNGALSPGQSRRALTASDLEKLNDHHEDGEVGGALFAAAHTDNQIRNDSLVRESLGRDHDTQDERYFLVPHLIDHVWGTIFAPTSNFDGSRKKVIEQSPAYDSHSMLEPDFKAADVNDLALLQVIDTERAAEKFGGADGGFNRRDREEKADAMFADDDTFDALETFFRTLADQD